MLMKNTKLDLKSTQAGNGFKFELQTALKENPILVKQFSLWLPWLTSSSGSSVDPLHARME
jgi:hypothetical protein